MPRALLPPQSTDTMKLSELAQDCLVHLGAKGRAASTRAQYDLVYRQFLAYLTTIRHVTDDAKWFTDDTVIGFASELRQRGAHPNTIRAKVAALATLARFGMRRQDAHGRRVLTADPTSAFERPAHTQPDKKFLYPSELRAFMAVLRPRREAIVRDVLLDTGIRSDELCRANVGNLVEDGSRVFLSQTVKGGHRAYIPVSAPVAEALRDYLLDERGMPGPAEPLCLNARGARFSRSSLYELVKRIGLAAGITRIDVGPHTLRHTANVIAKQARIDPHTRSRLLTHTSLRTLAEYEHILDDELYEARERQRGALAAYLERGDSSSRLFQHAPSAPANPAPDNAPH